MAKPRGQLKSVIIAGTLLAGLVATAITVRWVAAGGPVGFNVGGCGTSLGDRMIVASSDLLLNSASLTSYQMSAIFDVGGRQIVVRGDDVVIDDTTRWTIPAGCKQVEFFVTTGVLRVSADGEVVREVRR